VPLPLLLVASLLGILCTVPASADLALWLLGFQHLQPLLLLLLLPSMLQTPHAASKGTKQTAQEGESPAHHRDLLVIFRDQE